MILRSPFNFNYSIASFVFDFVYLSSHECLFFSIFFFPSFFYVSLDRCIPPPVHSIYRGVLSSQSLALDLLLAWVADSRVFPDLHGVNTEKDTCREWFTDNPGKGIKTWTIRGLLVRYCGRTVWSKRGRRCGGVETRNPESGEWAWKIGPSFPFFFFFSTSPLRFNSISILARERTPFHDDSRLDLFSLSPLFLPRNLSGLESTPRHM